ncbi:transposase [Vibrio nigripulchritudo]
MGHHKIIGIDLAKNVFFLFEINHKGKNIGRKKSTELSYLATSQI